MNKRTTKTNLHDAFFRGVFSDPELCGGLLRLALSRREAALFDLASLEVEPGSFLDGGLKEHRCDLVASVPFKKSGGRAKIPRAL